MNLENVDLEQKTVCCVEDNASGTPTARFGWQSLHLCNNAFSVRVCQVCRNYSDSGLEKSIPLFERAPEYEGY